MRRARRGCLSQPHRLAQCGRAAAARARQVRTVLPAKQSTPDSPCHTHPRATAGRDRVRRSGRLSAGCAVSGSHGARDGAVTNSPKGEDKGEGRETDGPALGPIRGGSAQSSDIRWDASRQSCSRPA